MTPWDFAKVAGSSDLEAATHVLFGEAYEKWINEGVKALTGGQITVYCVETFLAKYAMVESNSVWTTNPGKRLNMRRPH